MMKSRKHNGPVGMVCIDPGKRADILAMEAKTKRTLLALPKTSRHRHSNESGRRRFRVLIVDDEELSRSFIRQLLEFMAGLKVIEAKTSEQALQLARKRQKIDFVISDIIRPGMDGLAFVQAFKKEHPMVPVIIVSGSLNPSLRRKAYRLGAAVCCKKPIDLKAFLKSVAKVLHGAFYDQG
jgi:DNA-binding NtrC family response regulator